MRALLVTFDNELLSALVTDVYYVDENLTDEEIEDFLTQEADDVMLDYVDYDNEDEDEEEFLCATDIEWHDATPEELEAYV